MCFLFKRFQWYHQAKNYAKILNRIREMHPDIKIQVSCDKNQSTLGSSSTILHPINEVRGWEKKQIY